MPFPKQWIAQEPYYVSDWELREDPEARRYWIGEFRRSERWMLALADSYPERDEADRAAFLERYLAYMQEDTLLANEPRLNVYTLDRVRKRMEMADGWIDPYRVLKARANEAALEVLPDLLAELDRLSEAEVREALVRGLMAGNLFDVGSEHAMAAHDRSQNDFRVARASVVARPWWRDDVDAFWGQLDAGSYQHVAWFVDNAGGDIVLGVLPLVRTLLRAGRRVSLLANASAALNDILIDELRVLLDQVGALDATLGDAWADGRLQAYSNGNDCPLMNLAVVPEETVAAIADASLLWLHGMGRGLESNLDQRFRCDVLRTAVVKNPAIAARLATEMFACQFWLQRAE